jgi:hypothetical protein
VKNSDDYSFPTDSGDLARKILVHAFVVLYT